MTSNIPAMFNRVKALAEDIHGIAIDGLHRDTAPDTQRVLAMQLGIAIAALGGKVDQIKCRLGELHD